MDFLNSILRWFPAADYRQCTDCVKADVSNRERWRVICKTKLVIQSENNALAATTVPWWEEPGYDATQDLRQWREMVSAAEI